MSADACPGCRHGWPVAYLDGRPFHYVPRDRWDDFGDSVYCEAVTVPDVDHPLAHHPF